MNNRPILVVSDDAELIKHGTGFILLPKVLHYSFSSLFQFAPLAMLAGILSVQAKEVYGRGSVDNWAFSHGGEAVKKSEIVVIKE